MLWLLFALFLSGLITGALGRLVVPGPNPMSISKTVLIGIAGSFLGGLVGRLIFGFHYAQSYFLGLALSVGFAALIVVMIRPHRRRHV